MNNITKLIREEWGYTCYIARWAFTSWEEFKYVFKYSTYWLVVILRFLLNVIGTIACLALTIFLFYYTFSGLYAVDPSLPEHFILSIIVIRTAWKMFVSFFRRLQDAGLISFDFLDFFNF